MISGTGLILTLAACAGFPAAVVTAPSAGAAATTAVIAAATRMISFTGHYQGHVSLLINNGAVTISSVNGKGTGTLLGTSTIAGKGSASASAQCDPFTGAGSITGAREDRLARDRVQVVGLLQW